MEKQDLGLTNGESLVILAYLLTSAQGCLREPPDYGIFRLLSAADKLAQLWRPRCNGALALFLDRIVSNTTQKSARRDIDPQGYVDYLADICRELGYVIKTLDD